MRMNFAHFSATSTSEIENAKKLIEIGNGIGVEFLYVSGFDHICQSIVRWHLKSSDSEINYTDTHTHMHIDLIFVAVRFVFSIFAACSDSQLISPISPANHAI